MIKVKSKPKENANTVRKKNRWKDFRDNAELSALMIPRPATSAHSWLLTC